MGDDMAPPRKRRRLSTSPSQIFPSRSELAVAEPTPTMLHSVEQLERIFTPSATRTVPQRIQEIHLQIQERAVVAKQDVPQRLNPRQATGELSTITTIDVNGATVVTTFTVGNAIIPLSTSDTTTTTSSNTAATTEPTASASGSVSPDSSNSTSPTGSGTASPNHKTTDNSTSTHHATQSTTKQSSLPKSAYIATLKNGDTETITRSKKPYVTTFSNSQVSTICDTNNDCKVSAHNTGTSVNSLQSASPSSSGTGTVTSTAYVAANTATTASSTGAAGANTSNNSNNDSNGTTSTATIAGGVVAGAAGLAIILVAALVFLRWYKRRTHNGHQPLPASSTMSPAPDERASSSGGAGMAERAGLMPLVSAVPALFRHQNRSQEEPPSSERGFTRVSGRKLPSAFSEGMSSGGMSSPPPSMPLTGPERNLSSTSFYRDSHGFYGGSGNNLPVSPQTPFGDQSPSPPPDVDHGELTLSPGPQRTPTVHTGGPYVMSPSSSVPATPKMPTIPGSPPANHTTFARSDTPSTFTDNRSSRFTEEV